MTLVLIRLEISTYLHARGMYKIGLHVGQYLHQRCDWLLANCIIFTLANLQFDYVNDVGQANALALCLNAAVSVPKCSMAHDSLG